MLKEIYNYFFSSKDNDKDDDNEYTNKREYLGFKIQTECKEILKKDVNYEDLTIDMIENSQLYYMNKFDDTFLDMSSIDHRTIRSDYILYYDVNIIFTEIYKAEIFFEKIGQEPNSQESCLIRGKPYSRLSFKINEETFLYKKLYNKKITMQIENLSKTKNNYFNVIPKDITNMIKDYIKKY